MASVIKRHSAQKNAVKLGSKMNDAKAPAFQVAFCERAPSLEFKKIALERQVTLMTCQSGSFVFLAPIAGVVSSIHLKCRAGSEKRKKKVFLDSTESFLSL